MSTEKVRRVLIIITSEKNNHFQKREHTSQRFWHFQFLSSKMYYISVLCYQLKWGGTNHCMQMPFLFIANTQLKPSTRGKIDPFMFIIHTCAHCTAYLDTYWYIYVYIYIYMYVYFTHTNSIHIYWYIDIYILINIF